MSLEDQLNSGENVEFSADSVKYEGTEYDVYLTNKRIILYKESGFFSKTVEMEAWELENIVHSEFKNLGVDGEISFKTESGGENEEEIEEDEVRIVGGIEDAAPLLSKLRARTS